MPALLWASAFAFSLLFAAGFILAANEASSEQMYLYIIAGIPIPLYMVLLLFGLAHIAGKVKRLEERIDNQRP